MISLVDIVRWCLGLPHRAKATAWALCIAGVVIVAYPVTPRDLGIAGFAWLGGVFFIGTFVRTRGRR